MRANSWPENDNEPLEARIGALAARQHGLIRRLQLLDLGLSPRTIGRRQQQGRLARIRNRVYSLPGAPETWRQRLLAVCYWAGDGAAASHLAAGRLWELDGLGRRELGEALEVTTPARPFLQAQGVIVHRSEDFSPRDCTYRDGIPVTTLPRTLIDLAGVLDMESLERAFESALRWRPGLEGCLWQRVRVLGGKGRSGIGKLERLLKVSSGRSDRCDSDLELKALQLLTRAGDRPAEMHYVVLDEAAVHVATLDFAFPEARVGLEVDGFRYHSGRRAFDRDREKLTRLAALGWRVVHVTHFDLERRPDWVIEKVRRAVSVSLSLSSQQVA